MKDEVLRMANEVDNTDLEGGHNFTISEPQLVTVKMFDRDYHITSDQPQLVALLVDEINREAKKLKDSSPVSMGPGHFDWPVQVAFQLALGRFKALESYNALKRQVDSEADKMSRRINSGLRDMEVEKVAHRFKSDLSDLDDLGLESAPIATRMAAGLDAQETEKLAQRITAGLDEIETEKLAARVSAGLNKLEVDAEQIAQRLLSIELE